jgi:3-oxoacyl-[acyl-carrier protein] reductase
MKYAGKIALVTGARRGVGLLLARHFASEGAQVIGFCRQTPGDADLQALPAGSTLLAVDVADPQAVARAFDELRRGVGRLDIVVNNAAVLTSQYAMIMPAGAAKSMLDTNVLGSFVVAREAAKLMRKHKWGRIINISSMAASLQPAGDSVYAATKAAVAVLANVMAREFAPLNITCNTLGITAYESDMLARLPADKIAAIIAGLPLPRLAQADDILNVVDFFASERSSYITAQTVHLGGVPQ